MAGELTGRTIAVLATDGVEQVELVEPMKALRAAGAEVKVISDKDNEIQAWETSTRAPRFMSMSHWKMRTLTISAVWSCLVASSISCSRVMPAPGDFLRHFVDHRKSIFATCHGPWKLIDACGVNGKSMTSWPSLRADLPNAGADWIERASGVGCRPRHGRASRTICRLSTRKSSKHSAPVEDAAKVRLT